MSLHRIGRIQCKLKNLGLIRVPNSVATCRGNVVGLCDHIADIAFPKIHQFAAGPYLRHAVGQVLGPGAGFQPVSSPKRTSLICAPQHSEPSGLERIEEITSQCEGELPCAQF